MQGVINLNTFVGKVDSNTYSVSLTPPIDRGTYYSTVKGYEDCKNDEMTVSQLGIQVTEACNLRCTYCYQFKKRPKTITFDEGKRFIDIFFGQITDNEKSKFAKFNIANPFKVHLIGGEAFLYPELCYNLIEYFKNQLDKLHIRIKWDIWIPTNGLNYDNEYTQKLINEFKDNLNFQISVDGCEECHNTCRVDKNGKGSYELSNHAFQSIRNQIPAYKHRIPTKFTTAPENIKYIEKSFKEWIDDGVYNLFLNWEGESEYTSEQAREYYYSVKNVIDYIFEKNMEDEITFFPMSRSDDNYLMQYSDYQTCGAAGGYIELIPGGGIVPCVRLADSSLDEDVEPVLFGNIYDGIGYDEKTKYNYDNRIVTRGKVSTYKCYNCPYGSQCYMCHGLNYNTGGMNHRCINSCLMQVADQLARAYGVNKYYRKKEETNPDMFFKSYHVVVPRDIAEIIIEKEEYDMIKYLAKEQ